MKVVCWKWENLGPKRSRVPYTAEHVNRLASMVRRNLEMEHEIVCITDNAAGISPDVRIVPMWDDLREFGMCWTRLKVFSEEMADIIGPRFVSIDLDAVITGPLDPVLDVPQEFRAWKNIGRGTTYCGSLFLMDAGARKDVWNSLDPADLELKHVSPKVARRATRYIHPEAYAAGHVIGSDQAWMSFVLGQKEAIWDASHGVYSYKELEGAPLRARGLPKDARIVFFHGKCDPSQAEIQSRMPWVVEHWR